MSRKKTKRNVNISSGNWVADFFKYIVGALLVVVALFFLCGLFVDFAVPYISFETEQKIFGFFGTDTLAAGKRIKEKERIVQAMLDGMPKECGKPEYPVTVEIVDSDMVNAFAFPGGRIMIMSGLLDKMRSENELIFILGHEMGHMKNRDHLRGFGRALILIMLSSAMEHATGISLISDPLALTNLAFSRKQENAADRAGLDVLNCTYGHVGGARNFFETLNSEQNDEEWKEYFSSHPDNDNRIGALQKYKLDMGYVEGDLQPLNPKLK
jgi:Zn-dependent protease with chaperone function